jgi:glc operon protein GlcG
MSLQQKPYLRSAEVKAILAAAEQHALANNWAVTIVVADEGGNALASLRLDGCAPMAGIIAAEKARVAALSRKESAVYETMINQGRTAFLSAPLDGFLEGGVPIVVDGHTIGSVGVSGVKSEQDAETAKAGIAALLS